MNNYAKSIINNERCNICPRACDINRSVSAGFCGAKENAQVSKVMVHMWEEPYLTNICGKSSEKLGSGAVFFSGCNLKCIYCQNNTISSSCCGKEVSPQELADIFKKLEAQNVCNINLVTPTHFVKQIIKALETYRPAIPIVYNTSGYEKPETILALKGLVDIFLFDFKYFSNDIAKNYSSAPNYPEVCKEALKTARNQVDDKFDENGIMQSGLVVRHLLLPSCSGDGIEILKWINDNLGKNTFVSLLNQYTPHSKATTHPILKNKPKRLEYSRLVAFAKSLEMPNVFLQDETSASDNFIPDFSVFCDF